MATFTTKDKPGRRRKGHTMAVCPICSKELTKRGLHGHLQQKHQITESEERQRLVAKGTELVGPSGEGETPETDGLGEDSSTLEPVEGGDEPLAPPTAKEPEAAAPSWGSRLAGFLYDE